MTTKGKQWWTIQVLRLSSNQNAYNTSKYDSNFKFSFYHSLNVWLLGATIDKPMLNIDGPFKF